MKKCLTIVAATLLVACSYAGTLEDWQFNDANGTALNSVTNTGTVGSSWNFGGPSTQAGDLNIGDATFYKWNPGSGTTFRTADFTELTSGQYIFEFVVSDWNMAGTDGLGVVNNGIKFAFGHTTNGSAQIEFEVAQAPGNDMRVRSQNSNNGNLSGTDAQNQLGSLNLTNTAPVTVQLLVDLDTGEWSTQVDAGSGFVALVSDGTGMTMIDRIQLIVDASNGTWEFGGAAGTATEFIKIDSVSLSEPAPDPWSKLEYWDFEADAANKSFGTNWVNSGSLGSEWTFGGPDTITTDGAGSLIVSNHSGEVFRKLPKAGTANANPTNDAYATAFTTGKYRLEMNFASWDLPEGADSGNLELQALSGTNAVALIRLRVNDAGNATWMQLMGVESGAQKFNTYGLGTASTNRTTPATAVIEFDFDNDTIEYFLNGELKKSTNVFNEAGFDQLVFTTDANWSSNNVVVIESMGLSTFIDPNATNDTPTSLWSEWIALYPGVGASSNLLDNGDSDDLDNLTEYAYGGDPSDGGDQGNVPVQSQVAAGGTNYLEYIYYERTDADDRGLASILEVGTDLVITNWADGSGYETASGASGVTGFNAITNRIPTDTEAQQFIRLQIEFTP
ncbi:hypothetical protein PDESU_06084 [Pontiella desulfatans]|uniref:Uncharacterized protein n=2 Tax=Pontiella desulfatans TaxID=2750659 RepID=A0A6C2UBG3_PONDE|nr:hypothetical protein PDESU_06084 [Pontiella desulfatans]